MFSVKVTHKGEIRRISFPGLTAFPAFDQLTSQLQRIFPSIKDYYLSHLLFSPDSRAPGRILVAREVRTSSDYNKCILQFRGHSWANASLRFSLLDVATLLDPQESFEEPVICQTTHCDNPLIPAEALLRVPNTLNHRHSTPGPGFQPESLLSNQMNYNSDEGFHVAQAKAEIATLLRTFQDDLDRKLSSIFGQKNTNPDAQYVKDAVGDAYDKSSARSSSQCNAPDGSTGFLTSSYRCTPETPLPANTSAHYNPFLQLPIENRQMPPVAASTVSCVLDTDTRSRSTSSDLQDAFTQRAPTPLQPQDEQPSLLPHTPPSVVHLNILCDHCSSTIVGVRHKCIDCPDFDLCSKCIFSGSAERHHPRHKFLEITEPGRVIVHTIYEDHEDASQGPGETATVERSDSSQAFHDAACDLCDSVISGCRYKCTDCPDFDTCESCFVITPEQHPRHSFVKISSATDYIPRDSSLRSRHSAKCDVCNKFIIGVRYKCMHPHCPDYDLCARCEAFPIPQHPDNHPMLKMRSADTVIPTVYRVGETLTIPVQENARTSTLESGSTNSKNVTALSLWEEQSISTLAPKFRETNVVFHSKQSEPSTNSELSYPQLTPPSIPQRFSPLDIQMNLPPASPIECGPISADRSLPPHIDNDPSPTRDFSNAYSLFPAEYNFKQQAPLSQSITPSVVNFSSLLPGPVAFRSYNVSRTDSNSMYASNEEATPNFLHPEDNQPLVCRDSLIATSPTSHGRSPTSQPLERHSPRNLSLAELLDEARSLSSLCLDEPVVNIPRTMDNSIDRQLSASFIEDVTVPDGEILAPGVTFVKAWRIANNGTREWTPSTKVVFVGGAQLTVGHPHHNDVQALSPGQRTVVYSCELKAPDVPGKYTSYWRLQDNQERLFGDSIWVEIEVVDASRAAGVQSLTSSSVLMPDPTSPERLPPVASDKDTASSSPTNLTEEMLDDGISDTSSISVISISPSECGSDDVLWADSREHVPARPVPFDPPRSPEYVVLYDDNTSEEAD